MSVDKKVPDIRFKGFSGAWVHEKIFNIAPLQRGFDLPKSQMKAGVYPVVMSNGINGCHYNFKAKAPGVVTGRSGTIGNIHYIETDYWPHNTALWVTNFNENVPRFIYYLYVKLDLKKFGTGSGVPTLNRNDVHDQLIAFPRETEEQTAIGNYLKKLDNLINKHQQKHDKLSSIKKAMLEKMFPKQGETMPGIRFKGFSGEWEQSNLGECTDLLTGNPFNSKEFATEGVFLVRGMNVKRGYLDTSPGTSQFWPSSKGLENYFLKPEDIVIQMDGALIGKSYAKIKACNLPALLVQRVTRVRCSEVNSEFIYQYIQRDFLNHISGIKTETAVPHLSLHDIRNLSIFLPKKTEQNVIGNYFQRLDSLINQHQQQITKLNNIKQACLSKMFV
jgi:type I restriction enzyme S subunit